ncbi:zeta toxin family protein [Arthrobacter sp. D1-29]
MYANRRGSLRLSGPPERPSVPDLILLNGPPGIGKSTLARMFVDHHPGTLNLDVDQVRCLIGG